MTRSTPPASARLVAALALPIVALAFLAGYHYTTYHAGKEYRFPITGYDPRDLLSGHYLVYRIDYGLGDLCYQQSGGEPANSQADSAQADSAQADSGQADSSQARKPTATTAYVCLEPKQFSYYPIESCGYYVKGQCHFGRFSAGLERFYVPEARAKELEASIQKHQAHIVLSALPKGRVLVKELLIDGQSWRQPKKPPTPKASQQERPESPE